MIPPQQDPTSSGLMPEDAVKFEFIRQGNDWLRAVLCTLARRGVAFRQAHPARAQRIVEILSRLPMYKGGQFLFDLMEWEDFMLDGPPPPLVPIRMDPRTFLSWARLLDAIRAQLDASAGGNGSTQWTIDLAPDEPLNQNLPALEPSFYLYQDVVLGIWISCMLVPPPAKKPQPPPPVEHQIVCVERERPRRGPIRIVRLGIQVGDGRELLTEAEVLKRIEAGQRLFFTQGSVKRYLQTIPGAQGALRVDVMADEAKAGQLEAVPDCECKPVPVPVPVGCLLLQGFGLLFAALLALVLLPIYVDWDPLAVACSAPLGSEQLNADASLLGIKLTGQFTYQTAQGSPLTVGLPLPTPAGEAYVPSTVTFVPSHIQLIDVVELILLVALIVLAIVLSQSSTWRQMSPDALRRAMPWAAVVLAVVLVLYALFFKTGAANATLHQLACAPAPACNCCNSRIDWANPADITYPAPLSSTQLNATANVTGVLTYSPTIGTILPAGRNQLLTVMLKPGNPACPVVTDTVRINVNCQPATITCKTPVTVASKTPVSEAQLSCTSSVPGKLTYSPALNTVLSAGQPRAVITVTLKPDDPNICEAATSVTLMSASAACVVTPTLTWGPLSPIVVGTPLSADQLNATAKDPVSGKPISGRYTYVPPIGTILAEGPNQPLTVTFRPDDTAFCDPTMTIPITVTGPTAVCSITPTIVWNGPVDIHAGTPLSAIQLNASAVANGVKVAGTLTYDPAPGTVLGVGNWPVTALFTPEDKRTYCPISITRNVQVVNGGACTRIDFEQGPDSALDGKYVISEYNTPDSPLYVWNTRAGLRDSGWITTSQISKSTVWVTVTFYPIGGGKPIRMVILNRSPEVPYGWLTRNGCTALEVQYPR